MLFEELSIMVGGELSDPDLSLVSVTDVIISRDLRNAKIFVSHDDDEVTNGQVLRALKRAAPYMRGQIAERCGLRMVPELIFSYDDTPIRASRINELLAQIAAEKQSHDPSDEEGEDTEGVEGAAIDTEIDTEIDSHD